MRPQTSVGVVFSFAVALAGVGCRPPAQPVTAPTTADEFPTDYQFSSEPAVCGEIRGRVWDQVIGVPLKNAWVSIDLLPLGVTRPPSPSDTVRHLGTAGRTTTDSVGRFRFDVSRFWSAPSETPRSILLRIRQIGRMEVVVSLRPTRAYVIEAIPAPIQLHVTHSGTLQIKEPASCQAPLQNQR